MSDIDIHDRLVDGFTRFKRNQARQENPQDTIKTEQFNLEHQSRLLNAFLNTDVDRGGGGVLVPNEEGLHTPQTDTLANGEPPVWNNNLDEKEDTSAPTEQNNRHHTTPDSAVGQTAPVKETAQQDRDTANLKEQEQIRQDSSSKARPGPPGSSAGAPRGQSERSPTSNASSRATEPPIHTAQNIEGNSGGQTNPPRTQHKTSSTPNAPPRATRPTMQTAQNIPESGSCPPQTSPANMRPADPRQGQGQLPDPKPSGDSGILKHQGRSNISSGSRPPGLGVGPGRSGGRGPPWDRGPAPSGGVSNHTRNEKHINGRRVNTSNARNGPMQGQQAPVKPSRMPKQIPELLSESKIRELEETIRDKDEQISQLKATISHLHRREGDPPKADREIATGFSDVACSIEQFVLQYCRTPKNSDINTYCPELGAIFRQSSCQPDKHLRSGQKVRMISAVLARLLCDRVFDGLRSDLVGSRETTKAVQQVVSKMKATHYQRSRWRAVTIGFLTARDDFAMDFNERVSRITRQLGDLLSTLVPSEDDNNRRMDALRAIVEQTSKLAIEIRKQADKISLEYKKPGSLYDPQRMEDVVSCSHSDEDLEKLRATVQIHIFPAILRTPCEWDGHTKIEPAVVLKAKVMAEPPPRNVSPEGNCAIGLHS